MFAGCRSDLTWLQKVTSQNLGSAPFCDQCTRKHGPCCNLSTGPLSSKPGCSASIDLTPQGQPTNDAPVMRTLPGLAAGATGLTYHENQLTNDAWYLEHTRREDSPSPPPSPEYDNNVSSLAEAFDGHEEEDSLSPASVYMDCLEELSPSPSAGSPQADSPPDSPALFIVESDEGEQFSELRLSPFPVFVECEQCNNYCCSPLGERIETSPERGGKIKSSAEKWQEIEKVPEFKKNIELSPNSGQTSDASPEPEPQIELSREHETLKGPSNLWQEIVSACEPSQMIEQSPDHKQEVEFNSDSCQVFEEPLQWTEQSKEPQEVLQLPLPPKQTVEQCLQDIELPHESMLWNDPNSGQELEVSTEPKQQIEFFFKTHQIIEMSSEPMIGLSAEHRPAVEPPLEPRISSTETQQNDLQQITVPSPEPGTVSKAPTEPWPETESSFGPWQDIEQFSEYNQGTEVSPNSWQILKVSEVSQPQQLTELSTETQGEFKLPSEPMKRNEVCTEQRLGVELNPDSWQGFAISTDSKQQNKPSLATQGVFKVPMPPRQRATWSSGCMQLIQLSHEPMEGIDLPTNDVQMFETFSGPKQNIEVSSKSHQGTELSHDHRQEIYLPPSLDFSSSPPPPMFFCDVKPYNDLRLTPSSPSHDEEFDEAESLGTTWSPEFMASEQPELAEEDSHISIQSHGPMQRVKRLTPYPYTRPRAIEHHENEDRDRCLYTVNPADLPDTSGGSRNLPEILELEAEDADYDSDNKDTEEGFCCNGRTQSSQLASPLAGTSGNARSPRHQAPDPQHANTTKSKQVFFGNVQIHSKLVKSTTQTSYDHKPTIAQGRKRSRKSSRQEEINDEIEMTLRRSTVARRTSTIFSHSRTPKPCSTVSRHQSDYGEEDENCCSRSSKSQRLNNPTLMILYSGEDVPSYLPNFLPTPGRLSPTLEDSAKISCSSHALGQQGPSFTRNRSGMMMRATLNPPAESETDKTEEEKVKRTIASEDKDSDA